MAIIGISSSFNDPELDTLRPTRRVPEVEAMLKAGSKKSFAPSQSSMVDGETRIIKASRNFSTHKHNRFSVEAERIDCDTPVVNLRVGDDCLSLTDVEALDLIDRLQRALSMLPSSK